MAEFYDPETGNLLRVENAPTGEVQICVAKNGFMPLQRRTFLRYLKAEGFIPGEVQRVIWSFDPTWPYAETKFNRYTRRLGWRLLLGLTIGWMLLIWFTAFR